MAVAKIDPKVIFASEAPAQDTPAVFTNKTVGWGESRKNGGRPTIKQSNALQQETDLKILWLNENSVTPFDATIDYPENAVTIKDGVFKTLKLGVWGLFLDKSSVGLGNVDNTSDLNKPISTATQVALNLKADKSTTYTKAEINSALSSVGSTISHNDLLDRSEAEAHPATSIGDDSGLNQQEVNNVTARSVKSIAEMLAIPTPFDGQMVDVLSYHAPDYTQPVVPVIEGGGLFRYVSALSAINDGGVCINGWLRHKVTYNYLTPEMFGAKGIGSAFDDYQAIQNMLDAGAIGCTFEFDGAKTYYNAFGNFTPLSPWLDEADRPQWTRNKRCTFKFNGAKLTRRRPDWNTNNGVNDGNIGDYYTDDRTGLLKCIGTGEDDDVWYMYGANFDSNVPLGWLYDFNTGLYDIGDGSYGAGTCMDWGLRLENIGVIKGEMCSFQKACFPISGVNCGLVYFNGLTLKYAAQARYRTNAIDPGAFGGGIKLEECETIFLDNVYGFKNANDTVELERYNKNAFVRGRSIKDINQSLMIYSSSNTTLDWEASEIIRGSGLTIKASGAGTDSSNVRGKIVLKQVYGTGLDIIIDSDYDRDLTGIDLDVYTENCGYTGLQITNNSASYMPKGLRIHHVDMNGNTWSGTSRIFSGKMSGVISGVNHAINGYTYPAGFKGFVIQGTNTKDSCLTMNLDLTEIPLVWEVAETAFVSLRNTVTSWGVFNLTADRQNISGGASAGLHYPYNSSNISSSELALDGEKLKAVNLASIASENGQIYVDLSSGVNVGSGTAYNVKLFKTP